MRYCGSKNDHVPHNWQQIGRPNGPIFTCPGKPSQPIPLNDPMQLDLLDGERQLEHLRGQLDRHEAMMRVRMRDA